MAPKVDYNDLDICTHTVHHGRVQYSYLFSLRKHQGVTSAKSLVLVSQPIFDYCRGTCDTLNIPISGS